MRSRRCGIGWRRRTTSSTHQPTGQRPQTACARAADPSTYRNACSWGAPARGAGLTRRAAKQHSAGHRSRGCRQRQRRGHRSRGCGGRARSGVWSRAVERVVACGRACGRARSRAVERVVACGRACGRVRSGVLSRAVGRVVACGRGSVERVAARSAVEPRGARSVEGVATAPGAAVPLPLLGRPPCRYGPCR